MLTLNYVPASISVHAVIGTALSFSVGFRKPDGTPVDLTGLAITAPLVTPRVDGQPPLVPAFAVVVDLTSATLTLSLTGDDTRQLGEGYLGTPIAWDWYVWAEGADTSTELARGGVLLFRA